MTCKSLFLVLLVCFSLAVADAKRKDGGPQHGNNRGPQFDFQSCGGAKTCLGEEKLQKVLIRSGMHTHKTADDIAQLLDSDDDLGLDPNNDMLIYSCSALPDSNLPNPETIPGAAGHRRLQASSAHQHSHHHNHHHHHHHRRALQQRNAPAPTPVPVQSAAEIASGWLPNTTDPAPTAITQAQAFTLHSRSASKRKLYLDFNGHTTTNTDWNMLYNISTIVSPPYDKDGNPNVWSAVELSDIFAIWRAVSEDYAPFDIDVTTEEPSAAVLPTDMTRVVIGGSGKDWVGVAMGGNAYTPSFGMPNSQPAFVFAVDLANNAKYIWEATSHEAGHTLGLSHDGDVTGSSYYRGSADWGPIMGAPYASSVTQFSNGTYTGANNMEDDFAIVARYLPLIAQEQGSTTATATTLSFTKSGTKKVATVGAVIRKPEDIDLYKFTVTSTVTATIQVVPVAPWGTANRANLNTTVRVQNSAGNNIAIGTGMGVTLSSVALPGVSTGTAYFVNITASGNPSVNGYTVYGSRGQYQLSVTY